MEQTEVKISPRSYLGRSADTALKFAAALSAICALLLTFTLSDYYIFNRISTYGFVFCLSQWAKKAGLILIVLAAFFNCRRCGDAVKYMLPVFLILSCCLFGDFFDAEVIITGDDATSVNREIFKSINDFFPQWLNIALFFAENTALALCCAMLFMRDGLKIKLSALWGIPLSFIAAIPLNIFENFFDINEIPADNFFRFYNFTIWHFLAICVLIGATVGCYAFLKNKPREQQHKYLAAIAVTLLLQYHSKDSVVLGDGYNVYNTIYACLPLFICNIGVYVASLSVILRKKVLYSISFFIHAVGALTVFIYFGKDSMSNYGIVISYSILYFVLTHCLLFILCVMPSALKHYKFELKKCYIPLIYYFIVIILASLAGGLVSEISTTWTTESGEHLLYDNFLVTGSVDGQNVLNSAGFMRPNYAFTQVNPLPFDVPNLIPLGGFMSYINLFYVLLVYIAYVALFFAFYGLYREYLAVYAVVRKKYNAKKQGAAPQANIAPLPEIESSAEYKVETEVESEAAPTEENEG